MFGVIIVLDSMLSATASLMLFCTLIIEVSLLLGFKPGDKWPMLMMISGHVVGTIASGLLPFRYGPTLTLGTYSKTINTAKEHTTYFCCVFNLPALSANTVEP